MRFSTGKVYNKNVEHTYTSNYIYVSRGDSQTVQRDGVIALLCYDNEVVTLLSQPQQQSSVQQREHDGSKSDVPYPPVMELYNRYMGSVDRNNQL